MPETSLSEQGAARRRGRRRRARSGTLALCAAGLAALLSPVVLAPAPRLVWNLSPSAPTGLYLVTPGVSAASGDLVIARVPARFRALAAGRHYLPANVPLVKRVAAGPGETVCARGAAILIGGEAVAVRRPVDGRGRPMPRWTGCRTLRAHEYLLLMSESPDSFDGRYFGITAGDDLVGKARLIWAR